MAVSAVLDGMYDHIKIEGQKSYAKLALLFKTSKTSIFRKIKQIKSRTEIKGSTFFETEEGQQWLYQFIITCILFFADLLWSLYIQIWKSLIIQKKELINFVLISKLSILNISVTVKCYIQSK